MDTIYLNSENSKISDPQSITQYSRLLLNLTDEINKKRRDRYIALSNLNIYGKILKSHTEIIDLKYQVQHGMKSLNYLMDHILYQVFKITLNTSLKKHETVTGKPSMRVYVNKMENRITFKIKADIILNL